MCISVNVDSNKNNNDYNNNNTDFI